MDEADGVIFIQSRNYTRGPRNGPVDLIVFHDAETPETTHSALDVANYFAGPNAPQASCHYSVDAANVVQCVRDEDIAWHCPGANHNGIGIEHAGYARQSRDEWLDEYGVAMLRRSADLVAELCAAYDIPPVWLNVEDVRAGRRGIVSHRTCTTAFGTIGGHTDPGPDFPVDVYMGFVVEAAAKSKPVDPVEDAMVQFPICPITSGPLAGRWAKVRAEDGGARLRLWFGSWLDVPDDAVTSAFGTSVLDVAKALGKPALVGTVAVGQAGETIVVSDDDGDFAFRVKVVV